MWIIIPQKYLVSLVIFCFLVLLFYTPTDAWAKWNDKSDDLKFGSTEILAIVLIGTGIAVATYFIIKSNKNKDSDSDEKQKKEAETATISPMPLNEEFIDKPTDDSDLSQTRNNKKFSIQPTIGFIEHPVAFPGFASSKNSLKDKVALVGLTVRF